MGWFITAIVLGVIAAAAFAIRFAEGRKLQKAHAQAEAENVKIKAENEARASSDRYYRPSPVVEVDERSTRIFRGALLWSGLAAIGLGLVMFLPSVIYTQGVGEAKVFVDVSGKVVGSDLDPGWGTKAPWQEAVDFDLFSQEVLYAGSDTAPSYSGGAVTGREVTVSVGGLDGGSTQAEVDMSVVYSLDADQVESIYKDWRSQERFTKSIIEKTILSVARQIPSSYTAIEFRGEKRGEAADRMQEAIIDKLGKAGIADVLVNIQDIRFSETVQDALNEVENANQAVQKAEAEQRKVEVEAETARIKAQGVADANAILNTTLTPEVLQQKYIDALKEGTIYVVPDGSTPFIGTK